MLNVVLSADGTAVEMYFSGPQDETVYPDQTQIEISDPRWKNFYQAAAGALSRLPNPDA
jgi:hypothetical protein